jgi:hypothetical protein
MPYASDRQRRYMHAQLPSIAARWDAEEKRRRHPRKAKEAIKRRASRVQR